MRKSFWIILAALLVAVGVSHARADSFTDGTITFTVSGGGPTPTGSFVLDTTTDDITSLTVNWDGAVFNFGSVVFPVPFSFLESNETWCAAAPFSATHCEANSSPVFELGITSTEPNFASSSQAGSTFTNLFASASGSYSLTETVSTAPEPGTVSLMLLGIALVVVMRKRIGQRLPQAS